MASNRYLIVGDVHFKASYHSRIDNVKAAFEDKFIQIFKLAEEKKVDSIIITGDIFDNKDPYQCPPVFLTWIIGLLQHSPVPLYSIVGNHDIRNNDLETVVRQPIGTLFEAGVLKRFYEGGNVIGYDYGTDFENIPAWQGDIAVIHAYVNKSGGTMFGNEKIYSFSELELLNAKFVVAGHDHQAYPIEKSGGTTIVRPGALFRKNRDEVDMNRPVQVAIIDVKKMTAEYVPLKFRPASEVFNLEVKEIEDKNEEEIEQFIKTLSVSATLKKVSLEDEIAKLSLTPGVKEIITHCLDRAKGLDE